MNCDRFDMWFIKRYGADRNAKSCQLHSSPFPNSFADSTMVEIQTTLLALSVWPQVGLEAGEDPLPLPFRQYLPLLPLALLLLRFFLLCTNTHRWTLGICPVEEKNYAHSYEQVYSGLLQLTSPWKNVLLIPQDVLIAWYNYVLQKRTKKLSFTKIQRVWNIRISNYNKNRETDLLSCHDCHV